MAEYMLPEDVVPPKAQLLHHLPLCLLDPWLGQMLISQICGAPAA